MLNYQSVYIMNKMILYMGVAQNGFRKTKWRFERVRIKWDVLPTTTVSPICGVSENEGLTLISGQCQTKNHDEASGF